MTVPKSAKLPMILLLGLACSSLHRLFAEDLTCPDWVLETNAAAWQPRDSQAEFVYRDRLWVMGGWFNSFEPPPRDVWSSADGRTWDQVERQATWIHSDLAMSTVFNDRMWLMGGWYNGRLPGYSASNQVWSSSDGKEWRQATPKADWTPRIASAVVPFQDRMWLLGGIEDYYFGDETSLKNDVWTSADGKNWTQVTPHASWSPRAYHQAVVLNDRLYVFGGGNYLPKYQANNDVWSTADGVTWTCETMSAPWHPRLWFGAAVYRNRMWVLGGWSDQPAKNWGDVWSSADGKEWTQLVSRHSWKERHEPSVFVFRDKLWVAGGHATPLSNEVWSLRLPPSHEPK